MEIAGITFRTAIRVISESRSEVVVQYPAYTLLGVGFLITGILALAILYIFIFNYRAALNRSGWWLFWFFPWLFGLPFLIGGLYVATSTTTVTASRETGRLTLHHTVAGITVNSTAFPLTDVQEVRVGIGRGCLFLYVNVADGSSPVLMPCTDRPGYKQAANALNSFLDDSGQRTTSQ